MLYRPLTRLETGAYAAIVAVLIAVFFDRMLDQFEFAERVAMEVTVSHVNSGVNIRLAYDRLRGVAAASDWSERNPFELARMSPPNFLGERSSARLGAVARGSWIYDGRRAELVYLPRWKRSLRTRDPDGALRFRLQPPVQGGAFMLVPTSKYDWQ
jgi:hypothetical protein